MKKEELKILSFQDAMVMQSERKKYDRTKWIYIPDFYTEYRYILGTVGNNPLVTIGINPSTAEPEKMDNTMNSVERIAIWAAWGTNIEKRNYLKECLEDMVNIADQHKAVWCKVGKCSVKGHPHHPLYLKKDSRIEEFDVEKYLALL